jgi:motility quorum-sensing regulator/GCU-specific mRNA interferase toxin
VEKKKAHYPLAKVKETVERLGMDAFTTTAKTGAAALGLNDEAALSIVHGLENRMLQKSMTTYADHTVWQDVYHAPCPNGKTAYIKLTLREDRVVVQFKEKKDENV